MIKIKSNHELIRTQHGKRPGFSTDYACAVGAILCADLYDLDSIGTGMPLENSYLFHGQKYREFSTSWFWEHYSPLFEKLGLPIYQPVSGCSEIVNAIIVEKYGFEECLRVRETHNDETFIKTYLDQELCSELNLFSYSFHNKDGYHRITDVSGEDSWQRVRDDLIKNVGLNSVPVVLVKEMDKTGTLILEHEHDGRDLELSQANKVFEHINDLWHGEVRFTTIIEDDTWEF